VSCEDAVWAVQQVTAPTGRKIALREKTLLNVLGFRSGGGGETGGPIINLMAETALSRREIENAVSWLIGHGVMSGGIVLGEHIRVRLLAPWNIIPDPVCAPRHRKRRVRVMEARRIATHTREQWLALRKFCGSCVACGNDDENTLSRDHIVPLARGGHDGISNIQPLCGSCNSRKGTLDWGDLRPPGWRAAVERVGGQFA